MKDMKLDMELSPPSKSIINELIHREPRHGSQDDDVDQVLSQNRRLRHSPEPDRPPASQLALQTLREIECISNCVVLQLKFAQQW